jgi:hypothetical protein
MLSRLSEQLDNTLTFEIEENNRTDRQTDSSGDVGNVPRPTAAAVLGLESTPSNKGACDFDCGDICCRFQRAS